MTAGGVVLDGEELYSLMKMNWLKSACVKWGLFFSRFILKSLSIFGNINLLAYLAKKKSRKKINKRAIELMEQTRNAELTNNDIT